MAEIKSTLELVLEKTKHLTLSAEEKEELHLQDALKKVPGYVERIIDGLITSEQVLHEIEALPQELGERVRQEVARQMSQALDFSEKTDPLIEALEMLAEPGWADLLDQVKRCRSDYGRARRAAWQQAQHRSLAILADAGIRGSAVVAKLEDDPSWRAEDRKLRQPCEQLLTAMQEELA